MVSKVPATAKRRVAAPAATKKKAVPPRAATAPRRAGDRPYEVLIRYRDETGGIATLTLTVDDRSFSPDVERWRYVVANRRRITRTSRHPERRPGRVGWSCNAVCRSLTV